MNFAAKISLGVLGLGALVGVWYADEHFTKKETEQKKVSGKPVAFEVEKIKSLTLSLPTETFVFQRDNVTSPWKFGGNRAELKTKPDQDAVNNLIAALDTLPVESELEGTENAAKVTSADATYGFDKPRAKLEIALEGGKTEVFVLGADLNLGTSLPGKGNPSQGSASGNGSIGAVSAYAISSTKQKVLVVGNSIVSATQKNYGDFRSKIAGDFAVNDVKAFTLQKNDGTFIELSKGEKDWQITKPEALLADNNNIGLFIDKYSKLRLENINEPEVLAGGMKKNLNLETPTATLEFKGEGGKVLQRFELGITKEAVWITMPDGAAGKVDLNQFADLTPALKHFRDRKIMRDVSFNDILKIKTQSGRVYQKEASNWYFVSGTGNSAPAQASGGTASAEKASDKDSSDLFSQWEFLTADDILGSSNALGVSETTAGLDKPVTQFSFEFTESSKKPPLQILVGIRVPKNEKNVYVKRSDKPEIFIVESQWTDILARMDGTSVKGTDIQAKK
jgi:Domain of unknown function (DUF4340)